MKRDWLLYLVIFSLALNLGTIGTIAYLRYQDHQQAAVGPPPPPMLPKSLWRELKLDDSQRQTLRRLFPEHHHKVKAIRQELSQKRQELFELIKADATPLERYSGQGPGDQRPAREPGRRDGAVYVGVPEEPESPTAGRVFDYVAEPAWAVARKGPAAPAGVGMDPEWGTGEGLRSIPVTNQRVKKRNP